MLILHTAFEEDYIYLWGECSFEEPLQVPEKDERTFLPWGAGISELRSALKVCGVRSGRKSAPGDAWIVSLLLPSRGGIPIPSSPMLGDIPDSDEPAVLSPFFVESTIISFDEFSKLVRVIRESGEKLPFPGIIFGSDLKFMCRAFEYAAVLVQRGNYIPDMAPRGDSFVSQWRPIILTKYHDEANTFAAAMPPVLCAFSAKKPLEEPRTRRSCALSLLETLTDMIVRSSQHGASEKGRRVNAENPHEIWIRSLIWQKNPLEKWDSDMALLYPQIRSWSDSLQSVTAQPWRMFMRLEEPISDKESNWTISWHLQSTRDPSLIIPASHVWSPSPVEQRWFEHTHTNPRRYMLGILGRLAADVPCVAKSLESPLPADCVLTLDELFDFLQNHLPAILDSGIQVQFPSTWGELSERPRLSLHANLRETQGFSVGGAVGLDDLLDVDWSVALGDDILTPEELKMLTELKTPLTNIRGRWVLIYRDEVDKVVAALKKLPEKIERREALFSSLRQEYKDAPLVDVAGSPWIANVRALLTGGESLSEMDAPNGFIGTLRPYQARGLSWLSRLTRLGMGACLADDMGLGKTVQTLALIKSFAESGEKRSVLLVCPTSVMENWRRETERFVPGIKTYIHHGAKRVKKDITENLNGAIVITSYALLFRDSALFSKGEWAGIILDEAQNIKNPDTRQSRTARSLRADWRIALTGTPVENHVGDMWSIMEFLMPGLMPNRTRFSRELMRPVQAGDKRAMEKVRRMTAPFILRRLKTDKEIINDLPDKIESREFCPLTREQASLYSAVTAALEKELSDSEGIERKGLVLGTITALKQVCDHPLLYLKDKSEIDNRSGKLARLAELAEEMLASDSRALIFTQYAEMGELLKKFLQDTFGREVLFLHGGVPRIKRDEMVRRFQEEKDGPPFFILSLKAGGTGLNLTRASHVVMFDRWWNPAVEQQAVDRAYRIGQTNNVQVHYFCCRGTLEEKIETLINAKRELAEQLVGTGENRISELDDSEIMELFSLEKEAVESI